MSTEPENVQHTPIDQQTDPNPTAAAAAAEVAPVDIDEADLSAAIEAAKAEDTASPPQPDGQGQAPSAQQQPAPREAPQVAMIPKPRLDDALSEADKLRQHNAYLQGQLDARAAPASAASPAAPQQPQQTPEQALAAIAAATDNLAKRFDDGDITMAEFKREERQLLHQEHAIREAARAPAPAPIPAHDGGEGELYLETLTAQLETQHPWVEVFDKVGSEADWSYLKTRARENLIEQGIDVSKKSAKATYDLRKEVSRLADELGPSLVAAKAAAKGIALPGAPASPQQQQQPAKPSPQAQARAAALAKAAGAPPDINALNGHSGDPGGLPTEGRVEAMSEEDYDALPVATRHRMMGITA